MEDLFLMNSLLILPRVSDLMTFALIMSFVDEVEAAVYKDRVVMIIC